MKSSTPSLSTLIVSSLHRETSIPMKDDRGKTSFPDQELQVGTGDFNYVLLAENDSFLLSLSPLSLSLILLCT